MIDLLTLQHESSQLISNLLHNHLQILVAHWIRNIPSGGWVYDLRSRLDIRQSRVGQALIIHDQHSHRFHSPSIFGYLFRYS
jgi:hypothetical protein